MKNIKLFYRKNAILLLIVLIFILTEIITARAAFSKGYIKGSAEVENNYKIAAEKEAAEKETTKTINLEVDTHSADAKAIARVLYGLTDYNLTDDAKYAIMEVIQSRVNCTYGEFGDTIQEVCNKPQQWQGYTEDGNYLREDYKLAVNFLSNTNRERITPEGCLYLVCYNGYVTVRKNWEDKNIWRVS